MTLVFTIDNSEMTINDIEIGCKLKMQWQPQNCNKLVTRFKIINGRVLKD